MKPREEEAPRKPQSWEPVGKECERFPVPGGWLYRTWTGPQSCAVCFVPKPSPPDDFDLYDVMGKRG